MEARFKCGNGCGRTVTGIYCDKCRKKKEKDRATAEEQLSRAKSENMKRLWKESRADMLSAIAAGRGSGGDSE